MKANVCEEEQSQGTCQASCEAMDSSDVVDYKYSQIIVIRTIKTPEAMQVAVNVFFEVLLDRTLAIPVMEIQSQYLKSVAHRDI